jgi:hypothetical protein
MRRIQSKSIKSITVKFFLCCFFLAVFSAPAFSSTVTIFSEKFVKPVGKPVTYEHFFTVPAGVVKCNIILTNDEDTRQVGQIFSVSVNGVQIFDSKELKGINSAEEVLLFQGGTNQLVVSLTGKGGNSITIQIEGEKGGDEDDDDSPLPPRSR